MKIQTSRLWFRLSATLIGAGYGAVGAFSIAMSGHAPNADLAGRAFWMGVTFLIASLLSGSIPKAWV